MGRKNRNVLQSFKCSQRYYARRHGQHKRFKRFTARVEREEATINLLLSRAKRKESRELRRAARRDRKAASKTSSEPVGLLFFLCHGGRSCLTLFI